MLLSCGTRGEAPHCSQHAGHRGLALEGPAERALRTRGGAAIAPSDHITLELGLPSPFLPWSLVSPFSPLHSSVLPLAIQRVACGPGVRNAES